MPVLMPLCCAWGPASRRILRGGKVLEHRAERLRHNNRPKQPNMVEQLSEERGRHRSWLLSQSSTKTLSDSPRNPAFQHFGKCRRLFAKP
jgi:hypothetical protein